MHFRTGNIEQMIHLPIETISGVAFGGPNLDCLLVTSFSIILNYNEPIANSVTVGSSFPLAPSPLRGQVLLVTGLGDKGTSVKKNFQSIWNAIKLCHACSMWISWITSYKYRDEWMI